MSISKKGFTLLEVLVSLAIIAFALTVILQAQFYNLRTCNESKDILLAGMLAREKMAQIELSEELHPQLHSSPFVGRIEEGGEDFSYRVRFDEVEKNLQEVNLNIIYKEGNLKRNFSITTYLLTTDKNG